ncbi:hypothetical protein Tco_1203848 [Tanacetum coccineum]
MGRSSLRTGGKYDFRCCYPVSPLGSSVCAKALSERTKSSSLLIISFTVARALSEKCFANSGHLSESMNDAIFMTSDTPMMNPVSTVHLSLNAVNDSLALLTILVISCGSLKHAIQTEYLAANASLKSDHSSMLLAGRRSNHPLAGPSRVCWNILHQA